MSNHFTVVTEIKSHTPSSHTLQNTSAAAPTSEKGRGWKRLLKNEAMARESPMNLPVGKGVCGSYRAFFSSNQDLQHSGEGNIKSI